MFSKRSLFALATIATLGSGCARYTQGMAAGDVIDPAEAAQTVVLQVDNLSNQSYELRTLVSGDSRFVGSVGPAGKTNILLDPQLLPTGFLYVIAIPSDGRGQAVGGPLAVTKGDKVRFTVETGGASRAIVIH